MKLSLKQARRTERQIGTAIDAVATTNTREKVSIYENLRDKITGIQKETMNSLEKVKQLTRVRFALRKAIETQNEVGGINALMNREAELKAMAKVVAAQMGEELTDADLEIAVQRLASAKLANANGTAVQSRYGEAGDEIHITATLQTETLQALRTYAKAIQRELLTTVDQLALLNASVSVFIDQEDVKLLEDAGIVVL